MAGTNSGIADKIKKFFAKKKSDAVFRRAGPGHKLTAPAPNTSSGSSKKQPGYVPTKAEYTEASRQAAEAALSRLSVKKVDPAFNTSIAAIRAQVRRELEAQQVPSTSSTPSNSNVHSKPNKIRPSHLAVDGVLFKCPAISDAALTKEEWKALLADYCYHMMEEDQARSSCLLIQSVNFNRHKVVDCIETLRKCVDNLISHPEEPKYHKIRCENAVYTEKIAPILGSAEFLHAVGFRPQTLVTDGKEETFLVWSKENVESMETLEMLRDILLSGERVELEVDRNIQVLSPAQAVNKTELPDDFYALTTEELKRERQGRADNLEKQLQLRTKAMREKEELREIRKYKFCLIRVKFPDALYLQGTFSVIEKLSKVYEFVKENLEHGDEPFILTLPTGEGFEESDQDKSLADLKLVPATVLLFQWHPDARDDAKQSYLETDVMLLVQPM